MSTLKFELSAMEFNVDQLGRAWIVPTPPDAPGPVFIEALSFVGAPLNQSRKHLWARGQHYSITVFQPVLQYYSITLLQYCRIPASITVLQHFSIAVLPYSSQYCSITVLQHYTITVLPYSRQYYSITVFQPVLQYYSITLVQYYRIPASITVLQHYTITVLPYSSQYHSITALH